MLFAITSFHCRSRLNRNGSQCQMHRYFRKCAAKLQHFIYSTILLRLLFVILHPQLSVDLRHNKCKILGTSQ